MRSGIEMNMDNKGSINLANGEAVTRRSKHIEVRYHLIRDLIKKKEIRLTHVDSKSNAADGLTKPLRRVDFIEFRRMIGVDKVT